MLSYYFGVIPPGAELDCNAGRDVWHAAGSMSDYTLPTYTESCALNSSRFAPAIMHTNDKEQSSDKEQQVEKLTSIGHVRDFLGVFPLT